MEILKNNKFAVQVFGLYIFLALLNSLLFGFTHTPTWQDASQYSTYATNLISGNGYSLDGKGFSNFREPGMPFFLALVYSLSGNENITVLTLVQAFLLALCAFIAFVLLRHAGYSRGGVIAGSLIALFPPYGYYTHEAGSELLFTFFVTLTTLLLFVTTRKGVVQHISPTWYLLLGVVAGYAALVRMQFLFFVPLFVVFAAVFLRKYLSWKNLFLILFGYSVLVGGWSLVCYSHTGSFALTTGRPELIIHGRAVRAELSYRELGQYYVAWVHKRVTSDYIDPMLKRADLVGLTADYVLAASTSEAIARIKKQDMDTIAARPMHYLAGNFIEVAKLYYIEYLYTPHISRTARAGMYASLYLLTTLGLWSLWRSRKQLRRETVALVLIMSALVLYNAVVLSFLDTIPRYNTPFLVFFVMTFVLGLAELQNRRQALRD